MALIPNVIRRGAIYYWRRRLPQRQGCSSLFVSISLKTADPRIARRRSARLTAVSHDLFEYGRQGMLTNDELTAIMRHQAHEIDGRLADEAALDRLHGGLPTKNRMGLHPVEDLKVSAECDRRRASPMATQPLAEYEKSRLRMAGWTERMITVLDNVLDLATWCDPVSHQPDYLTGLAANLGIRQPETDIQLAMIDAAVLRGTAAAYDKHARALMVDPDEDYARAFSPDAAAAAVLTPGMTQATSLPLTTPPPAFVPTIADPTAHIGVPSCGRETLISTILNLTIDERRIARDADGGEQGWSEETIKQASAIVGLLVRYLRDVHGVVYLEDIEQRHLDGFNGVLQRINPRHGKASGDADLSANDYIRRYVDGYSGKSRLSLKTRNRYWGYIRQLFIRARINGVALKAFEFQGLLKKIKKGDARKQRSIPEPEIVQAMFHLPPLTGCAGWGHRKNGQTSEMFTAGDHVFHRAVYFFPLFAHYHGLRRNEFASMGVDDIVVIDGIPCFKICANEFGTIKNAQSERMQAIHPEIIRLQFPDYHAVVQALGYKMLFPDLVSPSSQSSLGDRLYDEWLPGFRQIGVTPHQIRHAFNNDLKQKRVPEEIRQDFMGHKGGSESSSRYADALYVRNQLEDLLKVTNLTAHLEPQPIRLLPWVEAKKNAPWSFTARSVVRRRGSHI
ncbi:MAG: hypothetical protein K2P80_09530 [Beijerinckiaceae bacterium]|nr:hypothetical protein [Beijerinckiaceae bacterium]